MPNDGRDWVIPLLSFHQVTSVARILHSEERKNECAQAYVRRWVLTVLRAKRPSTAIRTTTPPIAAAESAPCLLPSEVVRTGLPVHRLFAQPSHDRRMCSRTRRMPTEGTRHIA